MPWTLDHSYSFWGWRQHDRMESILLDLGVTRPRLKGVCVYWSKHQINKCENTITLQKEVDKGRLILIEPIEMNSYISHVSRNTKYSLSLDWEQMPQSQLQQSRLIATGFLCSLPTFLLTSQFLPLLHPATPISYSSTMPARPNSHLFFQNKAYLQISNPLSRTHKFTDH